MRSLLLIVCWSCCLAIVTSQTTLSESETQSSSPEENMETMLIGVKQSQKELLDKFQALKLNVIEPLREQLSKLVAASIQEKTSPAFYAQRIAPWTKMNSIIPYHSALLNIGGGLSYSTGVFTTPVKGVYFFSFSAVKQWGTHETVVQLLHNTEVVTSKRVSCGSDLHGVDNWLPLDIQAILPLELGDTVAVYLLSGAIYDVESSSDFAKVTSFSGFLIQGQ